MGARVSRDNREFGIAVVRLGKEIFLFFLGLFWLVLVYSVVFLQVSNLVTLLWLLGFTAWDSPSADCRQDGDSEHICEGIPLEYLNVYDGLTSAYNFNF